LKTRQQEILEKEIYERDMRKKAGEQNKSYLRDQIREKEFNNGKQRYEEVNKDYDETMKLCRK